MATCRAVDGNKTSWHGVLALGAVHVLLELFLELCTFADNQLIITAGDQIKKELWQDIDTSLFGFTTACEPVLLPGSICIVRTFIAFSSCHSHAAQQPPSEL